MPLWLLMLLFFIGLVVIAERLAKRFCGALAMLAGSVSEHLTGSFQDEDSLTYEAEPGPERTLNDRLAYLYQGIEGLNLRLEQIERLLRPLASIAGYRMEKIGWDRFYEIQKKIDQTIELADEQKSRRKLMRDERGSARLVYEDEIEGALRKGWTLPECSVVLIDVGVNKINVIKTVRQVTGVGLKEATVLVNGVPKRIKEGVSKEEADTIRKKFEEVGAKVDISHFSRPV